MRRDVTFRSEGAAMSGWFYSPDTAPPWPLVVMGHGFSATKQMVADKYAEAFSEVGLAVLLYDHRGFGESGGEPRQQINPWVQARGYRDAISFATTLDDVDAKQIAVWGDSISSGAALVVAALEHRVAGLAVQVPALGDEVPPDDPHGHLRKSIRETVRSGSLEPTDEEISGPMPVVWDDQDDRPSALKPVAAFRWFTGYGHRADTNWKNEVTLVRKLDQVQWDPGLCAPDVSCPTMFVVAPEDEMLRAKPAVARNCYERLAGPKEWVEIPGGHFGLLYYPSDAFNQASTAQVEFLRENLQLGNR